MSENRVEYPFISEPVEHSGITGKIWQLSDNPEVLLRKTIIDDLDNFDFITDRFRRGADIFKSLNEKYGIKIPSNEMVISNDEKGIPCVFQRVEKIHGNSLDSLDLSSETDLEQVKSKFLILCNGLLSYIKETYEQGGDLLWDIKDEQIMYGKRSGDKNNEFWFVDVDPYFKVQQSKFPNIYFLMTLKKLRDLINDFKNKYLQLGHSDQLDDFNKLDKSILGFVNDIEIDPRKYPDGQYMLDYKAGNFSL